MKNLIFTITFFFTLFFQTNAVFAQDHLIINQAAGVGKNADGALSHSFVEIYNPTNETKSLEGLSLQYAENGDKWTVRELKGEIPARKSFLVRANGSVTSKTARYTIYYSDLNWNIIISNDAFKFALVDGIKALDVNNPGPAQDVIDLIGAYNSSYTPKVDYGEGNAPFGDISKQKSARRVNFQDTDNNAADFVSLHYGNISEMQIREFRPRSLKDGEWEAGDKSPLPEPPVSGTITFSNNAGIYTNNFDLTLTASNVPGATIYYTIDGSDPDPDNVGNTGNKTDPLNDHRLKDVSYIYIVVPQYRL